MKTRLSHTFEDIVSIENLLEAWREFLPGKSNKRDVQTFQRLLAECIIPLHEELENGDYRHGAYTHFRIADPKPRNIHKATVRDRLVHHAIYRILYPFFSRTFIADSYSCQREKGTHRALERFKSFANAVSVNRTRTCWVLKCDIRKFFASIDHGTLLRLLAERIPDTRTMALLRGVVESFAWVPGKGLPLGNLTSQLFVNVYMTPFDQFVKHQLKATHYLRYADDFVVMSRNRRWLEVIVRNIESFLREQLQLTLHPRKVSIGTLAAGVDFLGWVHFLDHRILRTASKRRMLKRVGANATEPTMRSYLGLLQHGNSEKLRQQVLNSCFLDRD